ncbi:MAG: hypothetical protein JRJ19_16550, partial [Deltaproteobacteria bacterium]|nr:hypothetical protein [Deltaproteobacteria bacterium]
ECYLDRGEWNNALKVVEKAMYVQSDDFYILELSAKAHLGAEKPSRAAMVYKRIARIARLLGDDERAQQAQEKIKELTPKEAESPSFGPPPIPKKSPAKPVEPLPEEFGYDDDEEPTGEAEPFQQPPGNQVFSDDKYVADESIDSDTTAERSLDEIVANNEDIAGLMTEDALSEEESIADLPEWQPNSGRELSDEAIDTDEGDSPFDSDDKDEKTMLVAIGDLFSEVTASHEPDRKPMAADVELDKKLAEGLDVADFFVGQGLLDDALDILDDLSETYKDHPELADRLEDIKRLKGIAQSGDDET